MKNKQEDRTARPPAKGNEDPLPAGSHAAPELTDREKTPGSGMLPGDDDPNASPSG
jgi:hypothetical protein